MTMPDREKVIERLQRVSRYFKSMLKVGYDGDAEIYREHRESVKMAIELLKEQEAMNVDAFVKWCIDSHIVGDATVRGIKYWVGKYKEYNEGR